MINHKITPEVVAALRALRVATRYHSVSQSLKDAIDILDNADVFAEVDLAADGFEAQRMPVCDTCDGSGQVPVYGNRDEVLRLYGNRDEVLRLYGNRGEVLRHDRCPDMGQSGQRHTREV